MIWQTAVQQPCQLGESPFWHPDEQRLYWVDIPACRVLRTCPGTDDIETWAMPQEPGCIAPVRTQGHNSGLVIALRDGVYRAREWDGPLELLARGLHDPNTTRFNDGKCDALGRLWAGTMYEPRDQPLAALYCLDAQDTSMDDTPVLRKMLGPATTANGLAWSPDGRTMYWADTAAHVVHAWDFAMPSASVQNQRVFQQFAAKPANGTAGSEYRGRPDGAAVDALGNYYVAMYEGGRVLKFSPAGELLADIATPAMCPTMPCFGGADLRTLYLTTASRQRPQAELQAFPASGCVLSMRVDTPGLPVNFFTERAP